MSVKQLPRLKRRQLSSKQLQQHNFVAGQQGEDRAVHFLQECGYRVLQRNVVFGRVELDIIALDISQDTLVFCEVKTRKTLQFGHPSQAVNQKKVSHLIRAAEQYVRVCKWQGDYRFDTISITAEGIEHFKNITWGL